MIYDEPARARRLCPCGKYAHVRTRICEACGHCFDGQVAAIKSVDRTNIKSDGPGRGKKYCEGCEKYVGVRTQACSCGYDFSSGPSQKPVDVVLSRDQEIAAKLGYPHYRVVAVPAGKCPHKPRDLSEVGIRDWISLVMVNFDDHTVHGPTALKYWVREFWPMHDKNEGKNPKYVQACEFIENCIGSDIDEIEL